MQLDYSLWLDNVKRRRYDEAIKDYVLSASFYDEHLPKPVRYVLESMEKIDPSYAHNVYTNTKKIHETVEEELASKGIKTAVRHQGVLKTETHIELYGEVDMLYILDETASHKDVFVLGQIIRENMLKQNLQRTDYGDGVHIRLITQKPVCKINLIPCSWINNSQFVKTRNELYHAIAIYNFKEKTKKKYLPFLNMARISSKDNATRGNYKRLIRLMRSLCADAFISLSVYDLVGLFYSLADDRLLTKDHQHLQFLPNITTHLKLLLGGNKSKLAQLVSPSEKELVFGKHTEKLEAVEKLYDSLQAVMNSLKEFVGESLDTPIKYLTDSYTTTETK